MRNILISIIIAVTITAGTNYLLENLGFSILIAVIVSLIAFFILTKKTMKELEILNEKAQKAIYSQKFDRAIRIYESGLELRKKSPFIVGQIYGMIGMLYFMRRDNKNAKFNLQKSSSLNWISKGMLGVIYMHEKNPIEMEKTFKNMVSAGKKEGLAWALYAYCLNKTASQNGGMNDYEWQIFPKISAGSSIRSDDFFGKSLSLDNQNAVVGAPYKASSPNTQILLGAFYTYYTLRFYTGWEPKFVKKNILNLLNG